MHPSEAVQYEVRYSLQIMLCGLLGATPRFRDFIVAYPVSFSLRYLYIRPISRTYVVCVFVRPSVTGRRSPKTRVLTSTFCYIE